jgi:hypothetical protein
MPANAPDAGRVADDKAAVEADGFGVVPELVVGQHVLVVVHFPELTVSASGLRRQCRGQGERVDVARKTRRLLFGCVSMLRATTKQSAR